jgi:hypothetical protein
MRSGEQHDRQPPVEVADTSAAGQRMTSERRSHVRAVADGSMQMQEAALTGREIDESAVSSLTLSEAMADPFGILGRLIDIPEQAALGLSAMAQAGSLSMDENVLPPRLHESQAQVRPDADAAAALFVTSIGTVEPLVTRLVLLLLYHANPQAYESLASAELGTRHENCASAHQEVAQIAGR